VNRYASFDDDEATLRTALLQSYISALSRLKNSVDNQFIASSVVKGCKARRLWLPKVDLANVLVIDP